MIEKPDGRSEAPSEIDVSDVGATLAALNVWLNQAKKLFAGPIDIAFMALGITVIAFAVWGRLYSTKIWAAPEFLGLMSIAGIMFLVAFAERVLVNRAYQADATLRLIRDQLENANRAAPAGAPPINERRGFRSLIRRAGLCSCRRAGRQRAGPAGTPWAPVVGWRAPPNGISVIATSDHGRTGRIWRLADITPLIT